MAQYQITSPNGETFEITAPDDATEEQVLAYAQSQFEQQQTAPMADNPADKLSGTQKFLAGVGKGMSDIGLGAGQLLGLVDQSYIDMVKQRDAPLMESGAGTAGNIVGNIATALPTMFIPGVNSLAGASLVGAGLGAAQPVASDESRLENTAFGALGGAGGQLAGKALGKVASSRLAKSVAEKARNVIRDTTAKAAADLGYVVPPDVINPSGINRALTGFAGKLTTQQAASAKNQEVTNALARKTLGLGKDTPITPDVLASFRENLSAPYKEIASLSDDAARALDKLKETRFESKAYWKFFNKSGDPNAYKVAKSLDATAGALEQQIEGIATKAGKPGLVPKLRSARAEIAKSHQIEKALNEATGNIDARLLAKEKYLTGDLKKAANFAKTFPKSAQSVEQIGSMPGVSPLDFVSSGIMGGAGAAAAGPAGLGAAAIPFLRPAVRSTLLSPAYQKFMATPKYRDGFIGKAIPKLLDTDTARYLSGLLGASGSVEAVQ